MTDPSAQLHRRRSSERLQQLQSEEMALRNLLDTVSDYTRGEIAALLQLVREEIDRERALMPGEDRSA
jgi:hypothetical protein